MIQGDSYARPTAVSGYDAPLPRRSHQHGPSQPLPNSSAFNTLSSVAMDELYALERQEALRRAEYEARHAEALRRAESQSRQLHPTLDPSPQSRHRVSKSATTSPIMRNGLSLSSLADERSYFGISNDRDWSGPPLTTSTSRPSAEDLRRDPNVDSGRLGSKRRLSGPALMAPPHQQDAPLMQSRSSGHLVDSMRSAHPSHHSNWPHPYHHPNQYRHTGDRRGGSGANDDSPSPISSDGEPLPPIHPDHPGPYPSHSPRRIFHLHGGSNGHPIDYSPPHYSSSVRTTTTSEFAFTPSTSPFLGPLRTLNIHSTNPSRAPSPILLPPPARNHDTREVFDEPISHSRTGSTYGSPPASAGSFLRSSGKTQHASRRSDSHFSTSSFHSTYNSGGASSQLPTPQLSSGPSSSGSSPGSLAHGIPPPSLMSHPGAGGGSTSGSGTLSASSSRAPSPLHWTRASPTSAPSHTNSSHGSHHLAHSVRLAFGMTPIHSHPPSRRSSPPPPMNLPRNTSWSASSSSYPHQFPATALGHGQASSTFSMRPGSGPAGVGAAAASSVPPSRAGSPPIRLPPLKTLSGPGSSASSSDVGEKDRPSTTSAISGSSATEGGDMMDDESTLAGQEKAAMKSKVELPRFSEFEAATRIAPLPPASALSSPVAVVADLRMSIDFVR